MVDNRFLLVGSSGGNQLFLIRQGIPQGKIIIGQGEGFGDSGGLIRKTIGRSLVKALGERPVITAKATSLGTLLIQNLYNTSHSKLVIPAFLKSESKIIVSPKIETVSYGKLLVCKETKSRSSIIRTEKYLVLGKLQLKSFVKNYSTLRLSNPLKEKVYNIEKTIKRMRLLHIKEMIEAVRIVPSIQVNVNTDITQRGNLLRVTANLNKSTQIWMRIINSKGMIVQKAGLVKKNSTGFQILIGTKDLEAGKYTIQISNHRNFSPLGVSEFEVKGVSPLFGVIPLIPLLPLLLLPDSPDETFEKVAFRTMQDSRVDEQCRTFENKIFNINDKNLPVPPIHFNCRCWLEGKK